MAGPCRFTGLVILLLGGSWCQRRGGSPLNLIRGQEPDALALAVATNKSHEWPGSYIMAFACAGEGEEVGDGEVGKRSSLQIERHG